MVEMACDCLLETLLAALCMLLGTRCIGPKAVLEAPCPVAEVSVAALRQMQQAAKAGDLPSALRHFTAAAPSVLSFNAVLLACVNSGGCQEAERWFEKMLQAPRSIRRSHLRHRVWMKNQAFSFKNRCRRGSR